VVLSRKGESRKGGIAGWSSRRWVPVGGRYKIRGVVGSLRRWLLKILEGMLAGFLDQNLGNKAES
jgi:hypothetical protein